MDNGRRWLVAAVLALLGALVVSEGASLWPELVLSFGLAVAIGVVLRTWWAMVFAAIPWPLGLGIGLATGRILFLGEAWQSAAITVSGVGALGVASGVIFARSMATKRAMQRSGRRS